MNSPLIRKATCADLPAIIALLADDPLGSRREVISDPVDARYHAAFAAINSDPNQLLVVAADEAQVVGCAQVTFIPGLSRTGMWRGQIEGVRIAATHRRGGLGRRMFEWAIDACRERECGLVQLTTDKTRPDAARFYEALGFVASHEGMKLSLYR